MLLPEEKRVLVSVTKAQAENMLIQDLELAVKEVKFYWGNTLNLLNAERSAVLLDMTYNCGNLRKWPKLT